MKIIEVEKKPLFFEEEELSPEEKKYRDAVELMESVDCVTRFERAVESLNSAAVLFEELGDYKDSIQKAGACKKQAEITRESGIRDAYEMAVYLQDNARTKMDYRTAISEFERFIDYKDSKKRIDDCKKIIRKNANRQVWRNRGIAILVLAVLAAIFWISPAKPFTKGIIRMKQGHYNLAIDHFREAKHFLNADTMRKKCRYKQALKAYEAGKTDRAMRLCRMADGQKDADFLLTRLELEQINGKKPGDTIIFGKGAWQILAVDGKKLLLLCSSIERNQIFAADANDWETSRMRKWLNQTYKTKLLNQGERRLLQGVVNDPKGEKEDKLYLLSSQEYTKYENIIGPVFMLSEKSETEMRMEDSLDSERRTAEWWLRDAGSQDGTACYVDRDGKLQTNGEITQEKGVRPVIQILLDAQLLDDTTATATPEPTR